MTSEFKSANLGNVLSSMATLYTLEKALLGAVATADGLEAFIDNSEAFAPRARIATRFNIDDMFLLS